MRLTNLTQLKCLGRQYLDSAREQLERRGEITPLVALLNPIEGATEFVQVDPRLLLSEQGKDSMFERIKHRLDAGGFEAIMTMFDAHQLHARTRQEADMIVALRQRGISSADINQRFRLGRYTEAVIVSVETIGGDGFKMTLEYSRAPLRFQPISVADGASWGMSRMKFFGKEEDATDR